MHLNSRDRTLVEAPPASSLVTRLWRPVRAFFLNMDATLALWHFRATSRRELARLDERLLKDTGLDRVEAHKPFWRK